MRNEGQKDVRDMCLFALAKFPEIYCNMQIEGEPLFKTLAKKKYNYWNEVQETEKFIYMGEVHLRKVYITYTTTIAVHGVSFELFSDV